MSNLVEEKALEICSEDFLFLKNTVRGQHYDNIVLIKEFSKGETRTKGLFLANSARTGRKSVV
jgi:hypothetical protein